MLVLLRRSPRFLCAALAAGVTLGAACAQPARDWDEEGEDDLPDRKRPGIFYRPAEDGPPAQLALARRLEEEGRLRAAARACQTLVHAWHSAAEAAEAQMALARILEQRNRHARAFAEYQYLVDNFPGRFPFTEVVERQYRIANHVMTARRGRLGRFAGFAFPDRALPLFEALVRSAPEWDRAAEARFRLGQLYRRTGDYMAAVVAFETLRYRYPGFAQMEDADFARAACVYELARTSPRDENLARDAVSALSEFMREYPRGGQAERAREMLDAVKEQLAGMYYERAAFYDKHRGRKPRAALIAYADFIARFPSSRLAERARARLERIKAESEPDQPLPGGSETNAAGRTSSDIELPAPEEQ